jgi:hypothetical protein
MGGREEEEEEGGGLNGRVRRRAAGASVADGTSSPCVVYLLCRILRAIFLGGLLGVVVCVVWRWVG